MKGFEEWFNGNYGEWSGVSSGSQIRMEVSYRAGVESRQAEINELKKELEILQGMHNAVSLEAGNLVDENDKLQKRIDEAAEYLEGESDDFYNGHRFITAIEILKGNQND